MAYITNTVKNVVGSEISIDDALLKKDIQLEGDTYQKSSQLPISYTQVDYIEATGTQYIDTGIKMNNSIKLDITAQLGELSNNNPLVASNMKSNANSFGIYLRLNAVNARFTAGNDWENYVDSSQNDQVRHVIYDNDNFILDGTTLNITQQEYETERNLEIFRSYNENRYGKYKLYSMKMYNNGTLIRDFIPCYCNADSVIGLYDLVNGVFYTNQGTGTFGRGVVTELPSEYTRVESVQNVSGAYIDTGYVPDSTNGFKFEISYTPTIADKRYCVLSNYNTTGHTSLEVFSSNKSRIYINNGQVDNQANAILSTTDINKVVVEYNNGTLKHIANGVEADISQTLSLGSSSLYMFLDRQKRTSTFTEPIKIYDCKLYNGGTLVRYFVPCYRNSNNVVGFYDLVNGVFYANEGTGSFSYDKPMPNPDYPIPVQVVTGVQEIQIEGKNLRDFATINYTSANSATVTRNAGEYTIVNSSSSQWGSARFYQSDLKLKPNTTYTFSAKVISTNATNGSRLYCGGSMSADGTQKWGSYAFAGDKTILTFTTPNEIPLDAILGMYPAEASATAVFADIQLEYGNQATNYAEHKEQEHEINLGKNLCDTNTFTLTKGTNRTIEFYFPEPLEADTYTISWKIKNQSGFTSSTGMWWDYYDGSTSPSTNLGAITTINSNSPTTGSYTRRINGRATYIYAYIDNSLPDDATITIEDLQVEIGDQATSYSQYFEPIKLAKINTYKDRIFKSSGENLFSGATIGIGIYSTDGSQYSNNTGASSDYIALNITGSNTYTISGLPTNLYSFVGAYNSSKQFLGRTVATGISLRELTASSFTSGTPQGTGDIAYIRLTIYENPNVSGTIDEVENSNIMLNIGSTALPYEPYEQGWYVEKKIGKYTMDGTEDWRLVELQSGSGVYTYRISSWNGGQDISIIYDFYCTHWKPKKYWRDYTIGMVLGNSILATTQDNLDGTSDITAFKNWLSEHLPKIYYILATPTYTKITNTELINRLESIRLLEGVNNISISSNNLSAILNLDYYSQENPYEDVIYSQDDENDIKIWFNDVELEDAGDYVERITSSNRIMINDASKRFSLDNFVSQELELTIHNINLEDIQDQVRIEIGTLVNNTYNYIPLGIFNIQDTPVNNHDKYIISLRDNRVKFDFNYNAKPLIDEQYVVTSDTMYAENKEYYEVSDNAYVLLIEGTDYEVGDEITGTVYEKKGTVTKRQILEDICEQAGVEHEIEHFDGEDDEVGIYDNTISANRYIPFLAEQSGNIATVNRYGKLIFVDLSNLFTWRIPLSLVSDDYKLGKPFEIERVVYESGVIKYETSDDETLDTLFLNSANPYINSQEQIDNIFDKLEGFRIDSVTTNNFLGNPAIDSYDIIEVYDDEDANEPVVFRTLANMFYTFNGKHMQTIDTQIGIEARAENVSVKKDAAFKKWAKTSIDNAEARLDLQAGQIGEANENIAQLQINTESISSQVTNVTNDLQNQITTQQLTITQTANDLTIEQAKTTSLETTVSELQDTSAANSQDLVVIKNFVFYDGVTGVLTLGERNSNFKLELKGGDDGEIRFMGNGVKLGYFNRSRLYVENTTVFNEQVIAQKGNEDDCNYYWHVTDDGCLDLDYGGTEE